MPVFELSAALDGLARAVARLGPSHRDPERFHIEKSEIAGALRALARRIGGGGRVLPGRPGSGGPAPDSWEYFRVADSHVVPPEETIIPEKKENQPP